MCEIVFQSRLCTLTGSKQDFWRVYSADYTWLNIYHDWDVEREWAKSNVAEENMTEL